MVSMLNVLVVASVLATSADGAYWLRFQPQSTGMCAGLPGGRVRIQRYAVGGIGYMLLPGFEVANGAKDASCRTQGPLILGARGDLAFFSADEKRPYRELTYVEPRAKQLAVFGSMGCVLLEGGSIVCPFTWEGKVSAEQLAADTLVAAGPVVQMIPETSCGLTESGELLCVNPRGGEVARGWKGIRQVSLVGEVGVQHGCAAMKDGTVECVGDNRYGQRGVAKLEDAAKPNKVPGLTNMVEVAASGAHVCARNGGGEVWCWGKADQRELGNDGFGDAKKVPQCPLDEAAMEAQRKSLEAMRKRCSEKPTNAERRDDPCRRMLWNVERSGGAQNLYKRDGVCETMNPPSRFLSRPVRVREVRGAVALAARGGMSCALTAEPALLCWGSGLDEPRLMKLRGPALPQLPAPVPVEVKRGASLTIGSTPGVCARGADGTLSHVPLRPDGKFGKQLPVPTDVVDHHCAATLCRRDVKGDSRCVEPDGQEAPSRALKNERSAGVLKTMYGQLCVLRPDGLLRCGTGFGTGDASTRSAAQLSSYGAVAEVVGSSACALFTDGTVGCSGTMEAPAIVWKNVKDVDGLYVNPQLHGCAVMTDGTVQCMGPNAFGQRGTAASDLKDSVPNTPEGLPEMEEVAAASRHRCARSKTGDVYCWGEATKGETGRAAYTRATKLPNCPLDEPMMRAQRESLKKTDERCRSERPPASCAPFFYRYTEGCQTPDDGVPFRFFAQPTRIEGVSRAVAIAVTNGLSCALLEDRTLACWGGGNPDVRTMKLEN